MSGLDDYMQKEEPVVEAPKPISSGKAKAHEMATKQRDISIAEFFEKNRHLLGFDNKRKALLTTVKEAVDNSLDACEEAGILPEINVELISMGNDRYRIIVEDNGPGIVKEQIPKIFAKLLYGSKFHSMKQSRGQQGIGISASVMYGQLTTGRPVKIISKIDPTEPAHYYELKIDTSKNKPQILEEKEMMWSKDHGTKVEIDLEGQYLKGQQSVDEYLKQTAIINPHVTIIYVNPKAEQFIFPRATEQKPKEAKEIKPHPYGVELGMLMKMLENTACSTVFQFLKDEFSRVSSTSSKEILEHAAISPKTKPKQISRDMAEKLIQAIKKTKLMNPPTDCIAPIGQALLEKGMKKEVNAEFYATVTRSPAVYRGNPFQIECAIAYGGNLQAEGQVQILRFANRVPLLYQQGACAITDSISKTGWKSYGLQQSGNNIPQGPAVILIHMASVWVPFTSEAKEALAHYPEIMAEIKLALQEAGRQLSKYTAKKKKVKDELKKRSFIEKYIPHVSEALQEILNLDTADNEEIQMKLRGLLEKSRGQIDNMEFDASKNEEYDEEFAKIGKEEEEYEDDERSYSEN